MLNPEASEYIPVSCLTLGLPLYSHAIPSKTVIAATFFAVSPPSSMLTFPFPSQIPACIPTGIPLQTVTLNCSFPPQAPGPSCGFLSLPPPPLPDVPPPSDPEFLPSETKEKAQSFPRVITGRKRIPYKHPSSCSSRGGYRPCGRRRGRSSLTVDGKDRGRFGFRGGYSRETKPNESCDLKKHGIMPLKHDEEKTTVMIKNIPYEFTRLNLVEFLDKHCMAENQEAKEGSSEEDGVPRISAYDFLYLPIDFEKKKNKGYAFVNFTESRAVWKFFHAFNATKWDFNNSPKIRRIVSARIQGKEALVRHFEKTCFDCESDEFLPACFTPPRDGSGASVEVNTVGRRRGGTSYRDPHVELLTS